MLLRNPIRTKAGAASIKRSAALKGIAVLFFLCILIKAAASLADASLSGGLAAGFIRGGDFAGDILSFELGNPDGNAPEFISLLNSFSNGLFVPNTDTHSAVLEAAPPSSSHDKNEETSVPPDDTDSASAEMDNAENRGKLFYGASLPEDNPDASPPGAGNSGAGRSNASAGITLDNTTDYEIDIEALLREPLNIKLTAGEPAVLIIHTHTSEAYTISGSDTYEESDPYRTEDKSKNITRVGDVLAAELEAHGIEVIHDRRSYDYPSYTGSYNRTYSSVQAYLKEYPSIKLVIDVHRDSITASDGSQYKTIAQIGDITCSQVMFVVGSDAAGLEHPTWRKNLSLALKLESRMNELYPTLARPVRISQYRYNQQLTPGSLILEVGCAGNTLEESITAVKFFAAAAADLFSEFYR